MRAHAPIYIHVKLVFRCGEHILYLVYPSGQSDLPGGHIEFGETIPEALRRELKEEMGYDLTAQPRLVDVWTHIHLPKDIHRIGIGYLIDVPEQIPFRWVETDEPVTFHWVHQDDLVKAKFHSEYLALVKKALAMPSSE